VAAVGLWQRHRWALWLAIGVLALSILSTVPGIPFGPTPAIQLAAFVAVMIAVVDLVLLLRPTSRAALTT